jgi:hypothetical protein
LVGPAQRTPYRNQGFADAMPHAGHSGRGFAEQFVIKHPAIEMPRRQLGRWTSLMPVSAMS